jgi:hypothetical protein
MSTGSFTKFEKDKIAYAKYQMFPNIRIRQNCLNANNVNETHQQIPLLLLSNLGFFHCLLPAQADIDHLAA